MWQERLESLLLLFVVQNNLNNIIIETVIDEFKTMNTGERRLQL
jgi:hypothetical protein